MTDCEFSGWSGVTVSASALVERRVLRRREGGIMSENLYCTSRKMERIKECGTVCVE